MPLLFKVGPEYTYHEPHILWESIKCVNLLFDENYASKVLLQIKDLKLCENRLLVLIDGLISMSAYSKNEKEERVKGAIIVFESREICPFFPIFHLMC